MNQVNLDELTLKSNSLNLLNNSQHDNDCESLSSNTESSNSDDNNYDDLDDEGDNTDIMKRQVKGLFTEKIFENVRELFKYESEINKFNIVDIIAKFNMDMISYIKMINFIREEVNFVLFFFHSL